MVTPEQRAAERDKYVKCYNSPTLRYAMGPIRMRDAILDLAWMRDHRCKSYLDIGCGRGEMLKHARSVGFEITHGTEIVDALIVGDVRKFAVHELGAMPDGSYDAVSSFDVIEHLLPDDDALLLGHMARIGRTCLAITANNRRSVDPETGNDLHVNKRPYSEWHDIICDTWSPHGWRVERCRDKEYVSETWRAYR